MGEILHTYRIKGASVKPNPKTPRTPRLGDKDPEARRFPGAG